MYSLGPGTGYFGAVYSLFLQMSCDNGTGKLKGIWKIVHVLLKDILFYFISFLFLITFNCINIA